MKTVDMGHAPIVIIIIILLLLMAAGFLSALHKDRISFITTLTSCYKPSYVSLPTVQFINATSLPSLRLYRLISQFPRWVQLLFLAPSFLPSFPLLCCRLHLSPEQISLCSK
jgi:hypothetical protein